MGSEPFEPAEVAEPLAPRRIFLSEDAMPKFHFEIVDGYKIEDSVGLDCESEEQARTVAKDIARQIAADLGCEAPARNVVVVDDDGTELFKTPIER
jgi:hypothetical protein